MQFHRSTAYAWNHFFKVTQAYKQSKSDNFNDNFSDVFRGYRSMTLN